jgi:hypothetical protein
VGVVVRTGGRSVLALGLAALLGLAAFAVWHLGIPAYHRAQAVPPVARAERLALPAQVFDPSPYARATDMWGAPGPLALVFRGRTAHDGLTGRVRRPWYAVSARTGEYWRLALPHLDEAAGPLHLGPDGTDVAWVRPGGVATYDTISGAVASHRVPGVTATTALMWSPRSRWVAVGTDPVRLLQPATGALTRLPLHGASATAPPAWTADGRRVTVTTDDAITSYDLSTRRVHRLPVRLGDLRGPEWSRGGDLAGVHPRRTGAVLRVVRAPERSVTRAPARVVDERPEDLVVEGFWGWVDDDEVVLTGLRPQSGSIERAIAMSLPDDSLRGFMRFPTLGDNWVGASTVSAASDLLHEPTQAYDQPTLPWSPGAKLLLCLLVTVFPAFYVLVARRPRG